MLMHLNLKDSGVKEVVVALREGSSSVKKAESEGLKVMSLSLLQLGQMLL